MKVCNGYIISVEKTDQNYEEIMRALSNKPSATGETGYKLSESLEWVPFAVVVESEIESTIEGEATIEDYQAALADIGVEV